MSTRAIRTSTPQTACDVCGRTLLRGERAEIYLAGGHRHSVCELCTSRALHGGWVREGTIPDYGPADDRADRRRSRLGLRSRRRRAGSGAPADDFTPPPDFLQELAPEPAGDPDTSEFAALPDGDAADEPSSAPEWPAAPPSRSRRMRPRRAPSLRSRPAASERESGGLGPTREPRHVHAVPTSVEHKIEAAVELFNVSEHPRTVAGIGRSLGLPDVSVHPTSPVGAIVHVVVAWELCWYRYEVDLSAEVPVVRGVGQGYELTELSPTDQACNAVADDGGRLSVRG